MNPRQLLIEAVFSAAALWGAVAVFSLPLRRRGGRVRRLALGALCSLPGLLLAAPALWLAVLGEFAVLGGMYLFARGCTALGRPGALYVALWASLAAHVAAELRGAVRYGLPIAPPANAAVQLLAVAALYTLLLATLARWMPSDHIYRIGPRQLSSAVLLTALFLFLYYSLRAWGPLGGWGIVLPLELCQLYCLTVLCLQTELFKKSALQKELDALSLLHDRQRQQYLLARQHVRIINRACHALKRELAALRRANIAVQPENLREVEESLRVYDAMFHTGSEVLDALLTDKNLLCVDRGIRLCCVADGARLGFLEAGDLYLLFDNTLDNAIEAVSAFPDADRRMIDVQVCVRQNFLVINIHNPLPAPLRMEDGLPLPAPRTHSLRGYGLRAVRRTLEKYGGMLHISGEDGLFTLRMVIPLPAAEQPAPGGEQSA